MSRIRTIKPEFWRNESLSEVSAEAALLAIGLLNYADDDGYFNANPKLIQADIFPLRELYSSPTTLITELSFIGYIRLFKGSDGRQYGQVINFSRHQVINKQMASKIKAFDVPYQPEHPENKGLAETTGALPEQSDTTPVELPSGKEGNGIGKGIGKERNISAPRFDAQAHLMSLGGDRQLSSDWLKARKEKKLASTKSALDGFLAEVDKSGLSLDEVLRLCCKNAWGGFSAKWLDGERSKPHRQTGNGWAYEEANRQFNERNASGLDFLEGEVISAQV